MRINSEDLSFVVQGPVSEHTNLALKSIRENFPKSEIILSTWEGSNINGLDLVQYIRNKDLNAPVVMITASLELENLKTAFKNGCNEYIKKPFHLEELEVRINNLLNTTTIAQPLATTKSI